MRFSKMAVAIDQHHEFKPFSRSQRCSLQSFTHLDYSILELGQTNLAHSLKQAIQVANIHRSLSTPCLSLATNVDDDFDNNPRIDIVGGHGNPIVHALVVDAAIAIASGVEPLPISNGLGGAYFLPARNGDVIAVAKPIDEEPLAFNNPKGFGGLMLGQPGIKRSVRVGETGVRELAAYLLDHGGFAGVPTTALVKISNVAFHVNDPDALSATPRKIASLQRFIAHDFDAGELGSSGFSVASVHRIGILDIRLLNLDRHAGNILVKKYDQHENYAVGAAELVPIDHGLCLPEWLDDPYFEWLHWPQASVPFSECEIKYISNLDALKDAELLRTELPSLRESSIRVLILCTIFLKQAAAAGLCLAEIGEMMTREFCGGEENFSVLETLCANAKASVVNPCGDESDMDSDKTRSDFEDPDIFQFESESELDTAKENANLLGLVQSQSHVGKPPKVPRFSSAKSMPVRLCDAVLFPLYEEIEKDEKDDGTKIIKGNNGESENKDDECKVGVLTKSLSFSVEKYNSESGGLSFVDMSEGEWEMFLVAFEELLPDVFEGTKSICSKQRLGTSCKF